MQSWVSTISSVWMTRCSTSRRRSQSRLGPNPQCDHDSGSPNNRPVYSFVRNRGGKSCFDNGANAKSRFQLQRSRTNRPRLVHSSRKCQRPRLTHNERAKTGIDLSTLCPLRRGLFVSPFVERVGPTESQLKTIGKKRQPRVKPNPNGGRWAASFVIGCASLRMD